VAVSATDRIMEVPEPRKSTGAAAEEDASHQARLDILVTEPGPATAPATDTAPAAEAQPARPIPPPVKPSVPQVDTAPRAGPAHVSDEVQFVEAFAEPGAEEGAGAEVHVEEPWRSYQQMSASEVISRLAEATREELATVELYERLHRRRSTVMAAAQRQLERATGAARDRS
jgi:hypothetical protein